VLRKLLTKFKLVGITIVSSLLQDWAILSILVQLFCALFGNTIEVILVQPENVDDKFVIFHVEGIVVDSNELQSLKVLFKVILVPTEEGNVISLKDRQPLKQLTIFIKLGIGDWNITEVNLVQPKNTLSRIFASKFIGNIIFFKFVQLEKRLSQLLYIIPIVQVAGKYTFSKLTQLEKALSIVILPKGAIVGIDVNLTHCNE